MPLAPAYLAELRRRVEAAGVSAVAKAAGVSRSSVWRMVSGGGGQRVTLDGVERVRRGLAKVESGVEPMPPPVAAVRSSAHWRLIAAAADLADAEIDALIASIKRRK